jgi:hypothetical protein
MNRALLLELAAATKSLSLLNAKNCRESGNVFPVFFAVILCWPVCTADAGITPYVLYCPCVLYGGGEQSFLAAMRLICGLVIGLGLAWPGAGVARAQQEPAPPTSAEGQAPTSPPVTDAAPGQENSPAAEDSPAKENAPAAEDSPAKENAPSPVKEDAPATENAPAGQTPQTPTESAPTAPVSPQAQASETKAPDTATKTEPKKKLHAASASARTQHPKRVSQSPTDSPRKVVVREGGAREPAAQIAPGMTPAEASRQRQNAEQLLGSADGQLKQLEGRPLNDRQQETVGQIHNYLKVARSALKEGDVGRASTLAQKAYLLSDDLVKH